MREVTSLLLVLVGHAAVAAGTRVSCGPDDRPHENGTCGAALIDARNKLCYLLSMDFPDIFPRRNKRSATHASGHTDLILADNEGNDDINIPWDWNYVEAAAEAIQKDLLFHHHPKALQPRFGSDLVPSDKAALEDSSLSLLLSEKRSGMSCECCFNFCRVSDLARYC